MKLLAIIAIGFLTLNSHTTQAQNINVLEGPAPMGVQTPVIKPTEPAKPAPNKPVTSGVNNKLSLTPSIIVPPIPGTNLSLPSITTPEALEDQIKKTKENTEAPQTVPEPKDACSGNDLAQILTPACLDILKSVRPTVASPTPINTPASISTPCNVAIYPYGNTLHGGGLVSFTTTDVPRCVEMATKMSFGIPSITNISTLTSTWGVVGIICRRTSEAPNQVTCNQQ